MKTNHQRSIQLKRSIALLLALSLAAPAGGLPVYAEALPDAGEWGSCALCSKENPHLISTPAELNAIRNHVDGDGHVTGYFQLKNDITFDAADFEEGGDFYNNGLGWLPIGHDGTPGSSYTPSAADIWLDGDGHTISGLEMHSYAGDVLPPNPRETMEQLIYDLSFIARPDAATIQNVTFDDFYIASRVGAGVVYSKATKNTTVKNVTVSNSAIVNMGGKVAPVGLIAKSAGGTIEDCTLKDSICTVKSLSGSQTYDGWYQALFAGEVLENADLYGITIENCTLDGYAYSALFTKDIRSGAEIDGVTIRNLNADWTHGDMFHFADVQSAVDNAVISNLYLEADMTYNASCGTNILPAKAGIVLKDSVLVYNQSAALTLTPTETDANTGEYENVYVVLQPQGSARSILYCAAGSGAQTMVNIPEALELDVGATSSIPQLPGGTASFQSSSAAVSVSQDGVITAEEEGKADVTVSVKMSASQAAVPLATISVKVGSGEAQVVKTELQSLYDQYKDKENNGYTADSWTVLQNALTAALAVLNDANADQTAVDNAKDQLEDAVAGLKMPEDFTKLTINGEPNANIYLPANAGTLLQFASQELQEFVKKISGAELSIVSSLSDDKLTVVLATPETVPEISTLFADDLAEIGELDGFAIRQKENLLYIIGTCERGVQNGVYDFLTENTGIIWTRANEELGTLYNPQSTISIEKVDYCEVPDFAVRGCGPNGDNDGPLYNKMLVRNKQNSITATTSLGDVENGKYDRFNSVGLTPLLLGHVMSNWLPNEKYFDEHPEYYLSNPDGTPKKGANGFTQLNFYNPGTAKAVAYEICEFLKVSKESTVGLALGDSNYFVVFENGVELNKQPFTADNGVTVYPEDENYKSTVFFNFLNRVAKIVGEQYPDVQIDTFAYIFAEVPPAVDIAKNVNIVFAPLNGDDHLPIETSPGNIRVKANIEGWSEKTDNLYLYSYWNCLLYTDYPRPLAEKVQADLHYLKDMGFVGIGPESVGDTVRQTKSKHNWDINGMYFWMMQQLFWDMDADLDALKQHYCDLAYGPASDEMQEFYRLIEEGWNSTDDFVWYITGGDTYYKKFIIDAGIADDVLQAIRAAYDAAETDLQRTRIAPLKEAMEKEIPFYAQFPEEDGKAYYSEAGEEAITSFENLSDISQGPWAEAVPLTQFRSDKMEVPSQPVEVRLLWDEDNLYIAYVNYDDRVGTDSDPNNPDKIIALLPTENWFKSNAAFMESYLCGDANQLFNYRAYYSDAKGNAFCYLPGITFDSTGPRWKAYYGAHLSDTPSERYWVNLQVVPFADMGVTADTARLYGTFVSNSVHGADQGKATYYGWCGANVWSTASFRPIELVNNTVQESDKTALQALYDQYAGLKNSGYTAESWAAFQQALEAAQAALNGEGVLQETVDAAKAQLEAAVSGLKEISFPVIPTRPSKPSVTEPETGWVRLSDGSWEYHGADGTALTGWQKVGGIWYYLDDDGIMLTGWQKIDGLWYYLRDWGGMATGWVKWNGGWYYLTGSGAMAANSWVLWNGQWYFLTGSGKMAASHWVQWKGVWYNLPEDGSMAVSTVIDGYRVDETGAWIA